MFDFPTHLQWLKRNSHKQAPLPQLVPMHAVIGRQNQGPDRRWRKMWGKGRNCFALWLFATENLGIYQEILFHMIFYKSYIMCSKWGARDDSIKLFVLPLTLVVTAIIHSPCPASRRAGGMLPDMQANLAHSHKQTLICVLCWFSKMAKTNSKVRNQQILRMISFMGRNMHPFQRNYI